MRVPGYSLSPGSTICYYPDNNNEQQAVHCLKNIKGILNIGALAKPCRTYPNKELQIYRVKAFTES
jgi:hypothetical protein